MQTSNFPVIKASGASELFDETKLRRSLQRSGASDIVTNQIIQELANQLHEGISTKSIFKKAYKILKKLHRPSAARYTLKQAMFDFGPSGFPFEDYFAAVMHAHGYAVRTRQLLQGVCVQHEMDVVADKGPNRIWVECKYHPVAGSVSNIKIPLYIHSRFRDLKAALQNWGDRPVPEGWIVTNTRFSDDAMAYGRCAGLHLVGWNYPASGSLRDLADRPDLLPITCLTLINRQEKTQLLENGIVLCKTLTQTGHWQDVLNISPDRCRKIMAEANALGRI